MVPGAVHAYRERSPKVLQLLRVDVVVDLVDRLDARLLRQCDDLHGKMLRCLSGIYRLLTKICVVLHIRRRQLVRCWSSSVRWGSAKQFATAALNVQSRRIGLRQHLAAQCAGRSRLQQPIALQWKDAVV